MSEQMDELTAKHRLPIAIDGLTGKPATSTTFWIVGERHVEIDARNVLPRMVRVSTEGPDAGSRAAIATVEPSGSNGTYITYTTGGCSGHIRGTTITIVAHPDGTPYLKPCPGGSWCRCPQATPCRP